MKIKYLVDQDNITVESYLKNEGFSRKFLRKAKLNDYIYINGINAKNYEVMKKGDLLEIITDEKLNEEFVPYDIPLNIVWEDEYLLIANKPNNLAIQPSRKHFVDNLISVVTNYYLKNNIPGNIHVVNRLDYSTSGLVIVAKSGIIHHLLSQQNITKKYLTVVEGILEEKKGEINLPIRRAEKINIKRWVFPDGKPSLTYYKVIKEINNKSILEVKLATGRTHQIRVHMAYHNHPVVGDKIYGKGGKMLYLHCYYLKFIHPITKKCLEIKTYPKWYEEVLDA
ncbi:MAG TPA: RluA family pseudouridine synthase [Acholeplasmataceae bacterium]|nr:RluA family pseudouridine synthase [Acholeplasmataceae bacterium]